jgi:putative membrane protein insertion efficiency factor
MISFYQKFISPVLQALFPWQCRFTPSCSEYGKLAVKKHGLFKGSLKSIWRIIRCNPWGRGGVDVP